VYEKDLCCDAWQRRTRSRTICICLSVRLYMGHLPPGGRARRRARGAPRADPTFDIGRSGTDLWKKQDPAVNRRVLGGFEIRRYRLPLGELEPAPRAA